MGKKTFHFYALNFNQNNYILKKIQSLRQQCQVPEVLQIWCLAPRTQYQYENVPPPPWITILMKRGYTTYLNLTKEFEIPEPVVSA